MAPSNLELCRCCMHAERIVHRLSVRSVMLQPLSEAVVNELRFRRREQRGIWLACLQSQSDSLTEQRKKEASRNAYTWQHVRTSWPLACFIAYRVESLTAARNRLPACNPIGLDALKSIVSLKTSSGGPATKAAFRAGTQSLNQEARLHVRHGVLQPAAVCKAASMYVTWCLRNCTCHLVSNSEPLEGIRIANVVCTLTVSLLLASVADNWKKRSKAIVIWNCTNDVCIHHVTECLDWFVFHLL